MSGMLTPRVTENLAPARADRPAVSPSDGEAPRARRMSPYHRASQRELVRASLALDGAYADWHGDHRNRRV